MPKHDGSGAARLRTPDRPFRSVLEDFSAVVLAGGKSSRMGSDKAFLTYRGTPFIRLVTDEAFKISDEVVVVAGDKDPEAFRRVLDGRVRVVGDEYHLDNPMGGMLSATRHLRNRYAAFLACDAPLVKSGLLRVLYRSAVGREISAALPVWEDGKCEPLCAVYRVADVRSAGLKALGERRIGCMNLVSYLPGRVNYVKLSELRSEDPELLSLINVNSRRDLLALEKL